MLEQKIEALTTAVEALTAILTSQGGAAAAAPAAATAAKTEDKAPAAADKPKRTTTKATAVADKPKHTKAEVQAAVLVAQQIPRDLSRCLADLEQSCRQMSLAERAFYRYSRGGQQVTGASVHLAREVARCFGNVDYGIKELSRDPNAGEHGQSEMMAYAWDQQTNVRQSNTFIVPWERHTSKGINALTDPRDLYENNANAGARRMRCRPRRLFGGPSLRGLSAA